MSPQELREQIKRHVCPKMPVNELMPYAHNSRTHTDFQIKQVADSILHFGFRNPIAIREDGTIAAGHARVLAAMKLDLEEVPFIDVSDMSEDDFKAYVIADNQLALNAGWDLPTLEIEIQSLAENGFDVKLTGLDDKTIGDMLRKVGEIGLPALSTEDKPNFQQMSFQLHDSQVDIVNEAIEAAKELGSFDESVNTNRNANALTRVCEEFLSAKRSK